jgi:hypothetical protein
MAATARTALIALLVLAATAPAAGAASTSRVYAGAIEPSGSVVVRKDLAERNGRKVAIYRARFRDVPLICTDGASLMVELASGSLRYERSRRHIGLDVVTPSPDPDNPRSAWRMRGTVVGPRLIQGTLRFYDQRFFSAGGYTHDCQTGRLTWSASRG